MKNDAIISLKLPGTVKAEAWDIAARQGVSLSAYIVKLLRADANRVRARTAKARAAR